MRGIRCKHIIVSALLMLCIHVWSHPLDNDSIHTIDGIEVSGMSPSNDLRSVVPQYSISSKDFLRLNISDVTSALRHLPGVTLRDYGGAGGMKTVAIRGLGAQHTGVALDGLLLTDVNTGQIDFQQFQLQEIANMSLSMAGAESIFLPARTLSSASVISITTGDTERNDVGIELGSWQHISPYVRLGHRFGDITLTLQGTYTKAKNDYPFTVKNGIATHRETRSNSAVSQGNMNVSLLWNIATDISLKSFARIYDNSRELPGIVRLYVNENDETLHDRGALLQSQLHTRLSKRFWLKSAMRWSWNQQRYHNGIPSGGIKSEKYIQREYYATSAVLWQPFRRLDVDYSIDFFHNAMTTTLMANPRPRRTSFLQSLSARWHTEKLKLMAQCLNSNIDSYHHFSPSLSASYAPLGNDKFMIRMAMKDIFRMPSMTELYYYHIGSQSLRPEQTRQVTFGITHQASFFHNRLKETLTADIYINKVKDKIIAIPFNMFVWRYMNVSGVLGRGTDITSHVEYYLCPQHTLQLDANYSWQRIGLHNVSPRFEDDQIAYTPEHTGSATLSWQNPWLNVSATITGGSHQWTSNEHNGEPLSAYREVAMSLFRRFNINKRQNLDVSAVVQNLFNYEYCIVAHYPMPGRNIKLSLTYSF